ncbi:MAG: 2,3-bisphosphoglycerate-independent phosphoglycerate mutase [Patescibacteria group bacterium]
MPNKLLLIILDGWGIGKPNKHNAIYLAKTLFFDKCWQMKSQISTLQAAGESVGLMPGQMGSSEVGHINIGTGRVVLQELTKINKSLKDNSFFKNQAFLKLCDYVKKHNSKLHLIGLLSDGGVHSHQDHLFALIKLAQRQNVKKVYVHAFLDGRDTPPASSKRYLEAATKQAETHNFAIATLCGRYFAMDRDNNWELTQKAIDLLVGAKGSLFKGYIRAIELSYDRKIFDEFVEPIVLDPDGIVGQNDGVIFFNFRADRMRQLTQRLLEQVSNLFIATMIDYGIDGVSFVAFERDVPRNHLCEVLSRNDIKYLKITETQKYPHLTYFFNGTREEPYPNEARIMIPSKKVKSFADAPEMSAREIADAILSNLSWSKWPVIMVNFANGDMVGHSGDIKAGIKACEFVDSCLQRVCESALRQNYQVIITADHGNVEEMYDAENDSVHTAHTLNPVPFILLNHQKVQKYKIKPCGSLANIAPTALELLGVERPKEMDQSLLV